MSVPKAKHKKPGTAKMRAGLLLLFPVMFALIYFYLLSPTGGHWRLVVEAPRFETVLYELPVEEQDLFQLSYDHSVSRRAVKGTFLVADRGMIKTLSTEFDSFGPGLPELDGSVAHEVKDGSYIVYHDQEPVESISLFVSPITGDQLLLHGKSYDLAAHYETPVLLRIYVLIPD